MAKSSNFTGQDGLTKEARAAVSSAFDALSDWRNDMATANDRYSERVFDQMAKAARSMGWPDDMIEATREQLQTTSKMQLQMMDKLMEVWEEQLKSPGAKMKTPADFFNHFPGMPNGGSHHTMPGMMPDMSQFGGMPMAPFQFWMQAAEMWQKNMASAMQIWTNGMGQPPHNGRGRD